MPWQLILFILSVIFFALTFFDVPKYAWWWGGVGFFVSALWLVPAGLAALSGWLLLAAVIFLFFQMVSLKLGSPPNPWSPAWWAGAAGLIVAALFLV